MRTFTTAGRRAGLALLAALAAAVTSCGAATAWHTNETNAGRELEKILREDRKIPVQAADGLPVKFDPVQVERKVDEQRRVMLRGVVVWKLAGTREEADAALAKLAAKLHPDAPRGEVRQVYLRFQVQDKDGRTYSDQKETLEVHKDGGVLPLYQLTGAGSPAKVTAIVEDVGVYRP